MILLIIIGAVVAILILGLFYADHFITRWKIYFFAVIALLILFSIIGFITTGKGSFNSPTGIIPSVFSYFGWVGDKSVKLFSLGQGTVSTVGRIILDNQTASPKSNIKDGRK